MEERIAQLEAEVESLKMMVDLLSKQQIKIAGKYDGTNVFVTINGISRKIATLAP